MNWKDILKTVAPAIATVIGGPLAGTGVRVLSEVLTGKPDTAVEELEKIVNAGLSPEQLAAVKRADQAFAVEMKKLDIDLDKAAIADTAHAREAHRGDRGVYWLGIAVLVTFALVMMAVMYGSYELLTGGMKVADTGIVAVVFGMLGTVVGYVAANAQQVVAYFFGSSRGSKEKGDAMAEAVSRLGRK